MWYWFLRIITIVLLKIFFRFKVEGLENIPQKTNFIVVANHTSFLDPILIGAAMPKRIYWIALRDFYHLPVLRWIMKKFDALPTGGASDKLVYLINKNKNVGLFPEGTRTFDGTLKEFKRGAALVALKTGRPILPCAILGAYEVLPRTSKLPRFHPIKVKIGKPKYFIKEFTEVIDDVYLQDSIFKVRNVIKEMVNAG